MKSLRAFAFLWMAALSSLTVTSLARADEERIFVCLNQGPLARDFDASVMATVSESPDWHSLQIEVYPLGSKNVLMSADYRPAETDALLTENEVQVIARERGIFVKRKLAELSIDLTRTQPLKNPGRISEILKQRVSIAKSFPGTFSLSNGKGYDGVVPVTCALLNNR